MLLLRKRVRLSLSRLNTMVREAHPPQGDGRVLFPFKLTFVVPDR